MSGGKGTQQTGSATNSAESRAGAAQFPYFQAGLQNAGRIYGDADTYPNYAPATPAQIGGYQDIYNTARGTVGQGLQPQAYDAYGRLLSGGGQSPATGGYSTLAAGGTGPQQTLDRVVNYGVNNALNFANPMAAFANQAAGGNVGQDQLEATARGDYLGANPYATKVLQGILDPIKNNFQTAISPRDDAALSAGGRYGSGAQQGIYRSSAQTLADQIGKTTEQFGFDRYKSDRTDQLAAASAFDQARRAGLNLGITGLGTAGNLVDQGLRTVTAAAGPNLLAQGSGIAGIDTGYNRSEQERLAALQAYPQFAGAQFLGPQQEVAAGTGEQQLTQQAYNAPFERLKQYMQTIGAPSGGASSTQPIFGNPLTSALSGATGVLGLGKELGLGSGLNSLLGGSSLAIPGLSSAASAGVGALFPGAAQTAAGLAGYAALPEIASSAAAFAPAAAATIICTELVRQGRMPNTWRLAGMRQFMRYPAIARRGYWVWATPVVAHLRRRPDSRFSKIIETTFNWRAEDLAARNGVKGARRLIRGRLVTAAMVIPCLACGLVARRDYFPGGKDAPA